MDSYTNYKMVTSVKLVFGYEGMAIISCCLCGWKIYSSQHSFRTTMVGNNLLFKNYYKLTEMHALIQWSWWRILKTIQNDVEKDCLLHYKLPAKVLVDAIRGIEVRMAKECFDSTCHCVSLQHCIPNLVIPFKVFNTKFCTNAYFSEPCRFSLEWTWDHFEREHSLLRTSQKHIVFDYNQVLKYFGLHHTHTQQQKTCFTWITL